MFAGFRKFCKDVQAMTNIRPLMFLPCWMFIFPVVLVVSCFSTNVNCNLNYRFDNIRYQPHNAQLIIL
jgi:hypothetical protein